MSKSIALIVNIALAVTIWVAGPTGVGNFVQSATAAGTEEESTKTMTKEEMLAEAREEEMVDFWLKEVAQPGPEHLLLEPLVGDWDVKISIWADGPTEAPIELTGTVSRKWALGDRYLEERAQNPMEDGGTYESVGYFGYNRVTGLFEHVWLNTLSTGMYQETGRFDPANNVIKTSGSFHDVETGFVTQNRTEISIAGPDRHILTGYSTYEDGREFKQIEIVHTRRQ